MRVLGEQGAEPDRHRDVVVLGEADELVAERRQRIAGSGPRTSSTSVDGSDAAHTSTVGQTICRWPSSMHDERADGGEVGERLGVDLGDLGGVPVLGQHADRPGRGLAGVVPAGEAEQQHGLRSLARIVR